MRNASARRVVAFHLEQEQGQAAVYLATGSGVEGYTADESITEDAALPRWLVRQVGFVEGVSRSLSACCPDCRERVVAAADEQLDMWVQLDAGMGVRD